MSAGQTSGTARAFSLPLALLLALLLGWPALLLLEQSLRDPHASDALTLAQYARLALEPKLLRALLGSLGLSAAVAAGSTFLCIAPAWLLVRGQFRGKRLLRAVYALPLSFSGVIVGFLMVVMLGRAGFVPRLGEALAGSPWLASSAYGFSGVVLAYLYFEIPRATLALEAAFRRFDFRLLDAAHSLGASRGQALRHVLLPVLRPALLSTLAVTFSVSLGSFGVVLILSTRDFSVLPLEIFMAYLAFPSDQHAAAALSVVLLALALGVSASARRWLEAPQRGRALHVATPS